MIISGRVSPGTSEWSESDSSYIRGRIDGYLHAIAQHSDTDKQFDPTQWENLYGTRVICDSFPAWTSTEARDRGEDPITLCDWDHATDTKSLKHGVDLPLDRSGNIVFEDGTVVMVTSGTPLMFTLDQQDRDYIERLNEHSLEMTREASDYYNH